jgi:hypothetical protein
MRAAIHQVAAIIFYLNPNTLYWQVSATAKGISIVNNIICLL